MPNTVEVVFQIDQPGTAVAKLKTLDQLTERIGVTAKAAGLKLDAGFKAFTESAERANRINEKNGASMADLANKGQKAAHSMSAVRNALLSMAGVPDLQGVEQLAQLGNPALMLGLAGVAAGIGLVVKAVGDLKEESKQLLLITKQQANVGLVGGLSKMATDAEQLRSTLNEVRERAMQNDRIGAEEWAKRAGDPDRFKGGWNLHKDIFRSITGDDTMRIGKTELELQNAIEKSMEIQYGIELRTGAIENKRLGTLQDIMQVTRTTREALQRLEDSPSLVPKGVLRDLEISQRQGFANKTQLALQSLTSQYQTDITSKRALDPEEKLKIEQQYAIAKDALSDSIQRQATAVDRLNKAHTIALQLDKDQVGAMSAIRALSITAEGNPYVKLYDQAADRIKNFREQFKDANASMITSFTAASDKILSLELFKGDLASRMKIGSIFDEQEKLRGGLGGADIRSKNAGIDASRLDLKAQINAAMLEGREFGPGGRRDLLKQFDSMGMTSTADRLGAEAQERGLRLGQDALLRAGTDKQAQSLALDSILSSTANIGALSSEQIDLRMRTLTQKSDLEKDSAAVAQQSAIAALVKQATAAVEKLTTAIAGGVGLKVTLDDKSKGAMEMEMGVAPTPESSGAVTSNPFRNDPMSGRY